MDQADLNNAIANNNEDGQTQRDEVENDARCVTSTNTTATTATNTTCKCSCNCNF